MPKYRVIIKEESYYESIVEADNPEDAEDKVYNGEGEVSSMDIHNMIVEEVEELS